MTASVDITKSKRVQYHAAERFDLDDKQGEQTLNDTTLGQYFRGLLVGESSDDSPDGRVFFGLKGTTGTGPNRFILGASEPAFAIDRHGNILLRDDGASELSITLSPASINYIYAYYDETDTDIDTRRFYDAIGGVEISDSVATRKTRAIGLHKTVTAYGTGVPNFADFLDEDSVGGQPRQLIPLYAVAVDGGGTITLTRDFRPMFAPATDGAGANYYNRAGGVPDLPHDFTPVGDLATIGISSFRQSLVALADRVAQMKQSGADWMSDASNIWEGDGNNIWYGPNDASKNVGIRTASPGYALTIKSSSSHETILERIEGYDSSQNSVALSMKARPAYANTFEFIHQPSLGLSWVKASYDILQLYSTEAVHVESDDDQFNILTGANGWRFTTDDLLCYYIGNVIGVAPTTGASFHPPGIIHVGRYTETALRIYGANESGGTCGAGFYYRHPSYNSDLETLILYMGVLGVTGGGTNPIPYIIAERGDLTIRTDEENRNMTVATTGAMVLQFDRLGTADTSHDYMQVKRGSNTLWTWEYDIPSTTVRVAHGGHTNGLAYGRFGYYADANKTSTGTMFSWSWGNPYAGTPTDVLLWEMTHDKYFLPGGDNTHVIGLNDRAVSIGYINRVLAGDGQSLILRGAAGQNLALGIGGASFWTINSSGDMVSGSNLYLVGSDIGDISSRAGSFYGAVVDVPLVENTQASHLDLNANWASGEVHLQTEGTTHWTVENPGSLVPRGDRILGLGSSSNRIGSLTAGSIYAAYASTSDVTSSSPYAATRRMANNTISCAFNIDFDGSSAPAFWGTTFNATSPTRIGTGQFKVSFNQEEIYQQAHVITSWIDSPAWTNVNRVESSVWDDSGTLRVLIKTYKDDTLTDPSAPSKLAVIVVGRPDDTTGIT